MCKKNAIRRLKKITVVYCAFLCGSLFVSGNLTANNITVSNASVSYQPIGTKVHFNLNWENSFRVIDTVKWKSYLGKVATEHIGVENWDAAWVFIKYRKHTAENNGTWHHASLRNWGGYKPADYAISAGLLKPNEPYDKTTNPILGAFIYRDTFGNGLFERNDVQLALDYNDADPIDVKVFVIEMVYVPEGAFKLGSGGKEFASFTSSAKMTSTVGSALSTLPPQTYPYYRTGPETKPYPVTSEDPISIKNATDSLWVKDFYEPAFPGVPLSIGGAGILPALFPKGYKGFYCMKYEISQQQYVDFLNTISPAQASTYYLSLCHTFGDSITQNGSDYSTTSPYTACPYIKWMAFSAYLDWSGLRPMTELEYEKACRGVLEPVPEECAWGNAGPDLHNGIVNADLINELSSNNGNCNFNSSSTVGITRVGISSTDTTSRGSAGATYYGIMDMSGNASEYTIEVALGRSYIGSHGDGEVVSGSNPDSWPSGNDLISTDVPGVGRRGGGNYDEISSVDRLKVSDRYLFDDCLFSCGRGVRTEPSPTTPISEMECGAYVAEGVWKRFMCHNLGAETTYYPFVYDENIIGDLYQWGRLTDGHEKRYSSTTTTTASTNIPGHSNFIDGDYDWRVAQEDGRWTDVAKASNDPCPDGYKVPSKAQWEGVANETLNPRTAWSNGYGFGDKLFLPAAGSRVYNNASLAGVGSVGGYWSSTIDSSDLGPDPDPSELRRSYTLNFTNANIPNASSSQYRAMGYSVRCIEDGWPVVTTRYPRDITETAALTGGDVTSDGGHAVTERGICWSTSPNPTIKNKISVGDGTGGFSTTITKLSTTSITYYVRAYATNAQGTSYGNEVTIRLCRAQVAAGVWKRFMCHNLGADYTADPFTPSQAINGNYYQWGIKKEVATAYTGDGAISPWNKATPPEGAWVDNGKTVNDPCPDGYRIPTSQEWADVRTNNTLTHVPPSSWGYPGGAAVFGNAIKFGESLLLPAAGTRDATNGSLAYRGYYGYYWSTYLYSSSSACLNFDPSNNINSDYSISLPAGISVRCIETGDMIPTVTTTIPNRTADTETYTGGTVISDGGKLVTARGVCFTTSEWTKPTIDDGSTVLTDSNNGIGSFESHITGITPLTTTYYARAYATNSVGTAYGNLVLIRSCKAQVASGVWRRFMCHNLGADTNVDPFQPSKEINGDYYQWGRKTPIATVNTSAAAIPDWITTVAPDNSWTSSGPKAANDPCPSGFRVPTKIEFEGLMTNNYWSVFPSDSYSWTHPDAENFQDLISTTLPATLTLPAAGYRKNYLQGELTNRGAAGQYWTSDGADSDNSYYLDFTFSHSPGAWTHNGPRLDGSSVRCIEDIPSNPPAVETLDPYTITDVSAISGGTITSDGGSPIVDKGIIWKSVDANESLTLNASGNPSSLVTKVSQGQGSESYKSSVNILIASSESGGQQYQVRAYAKNLTGYAYGEIKTFAVLGKCWAKISNTEGITFMCHNLGANTSKDHLKPCQETNGNYYRWGEKKPFGTAYTSPSDLIYGWDPDDYNVSPNAWKDDEKTTLDPCPTGYRIPSKATWELVSKYNEKTKLPSVWNPFYDDQSQFGNAILVGTALVLPMSGSRQVWGTISGRGNGGAYWTSLSVTGDMCGNCNAWVVEVDDDSSFDFAGPRIRSGDSPYHTQYGFGRYNGASIRCVKQ